MPLPKLSNHIFKLISVKSTFQKKKILNFHKTLTRQDLIENEKYLQVYKNFLKRNNMSISSAVDSYIEMCTDMFSCHIKFLRTGKYPVYDVKEARRRVYNNHKKMKSYMVGLAISQFFWKTHYKMFKHLQFFVKNSKSLKSYLEIGPGHGLFSYYSYENLKNLKNFHLIDISKTSLNLTKIFLSSFFKKKKS